MEKKLSYPYQQIADQLRTRIATMELGQRLPRDEDLALEMRASRETVRKAVAILQGEGVINVKHGVGKFVAKIPSDVGTDTAEQAVTMMPVREKSKDSGNGRVGNGQVAIRLELDVITSEAVAEGFFPKKETRRLLKGSIVKQFAYLLLRQASPVVKPENTEVRRVVIRVATKGEIDEIVHDRQQTESKSG